MGFFVAPEQGIPHQFSHRFPCQLGPVQRRTKNCFSGFWRPDITGHAHMFIDNIRHAGLEIDTGEDAFGGCISHLNGCNDKIRFIFVFRDSHTRAMNNLRGQRALDNMGFGFYKATKKTGAHSNRF